MEFLVIEDDVVYAEFVCRSLQKPGHTIFHFTTAEQGLDFLNTNNPDCIIIDYRLPGMNGLEFFEKIKSRLRLSPNVKAIMMSAVDDGRMVLAFIQKGIRDYVIKDEYVIDSINAILEGREDEMLFYGT